MVNSLINNAVWNNDFSKAHLNIYEALNETARLFKDAGIDSPRLDAELLLAHTMDCRPIDLYIGPNRGLSDNNMVRYREIVKKRLSRAPIQHILGRTEFMSLDFIVNEGVFIPRPETELIVEAVLQIVKKDYKNHCEPIVIFDIGTGSGNIGVSLAAILEEALIFASDISIAAINLAITNAKRHNVISRISFLQGDLFDAFKDANVAIKADFIVSNPPYVTEDEWAELQPEITRYEPMNALIGGKDGLDFYRRITLEARKWLKKGGRLILEIGDRQLSNIKTLINTAHVQASDHLHTQTSCPGGKVGLKFINTVKDLQGIDRVVVAQS